MPISTLLKIGAVAVAALAARSAYSSLSRRKAGRQRSRLTERVTPSTRAGRPADAFSKHAIEHDLSIGDAV